ncbi:hypothetical protein HR086_39360 [Myxococcus sp. CA039A]|nr:hypothetical protein [Myxococcus sp. CA039A]
MRALRDAWNALVAPHGFWPWGERTSVQMLEDALAALERRPLAEWREVFSRVPRSPVCRGELDSRFRATVVWVLVGTTRAGAEVAEQLLSGAWSLDAKAEAPVPESEPGAAMCRVDVPEGTEAARAWSRVLGELKAQKKVAIAGQLQSARAVAVEDGHLVLEVRDRFARNWVVDTCLPLLVELLTAQGLEGLRLAVAGEEDAEVPSTPPALVSAPGDTLPFELPPQAEPHTESLPDGVGRVFANAKGCEYRWRGRADDDASRALLSLAGRGGVPEVLRRLDNGVRALFKQRCDNLGDLVRKWNDNATPEARPTSSARAPGRPLNDNDYQEGVVESL